MSKVSNDLEYRKVSTTDNETCEDVSEKSVPIDAYGYGVRHVQTLIIFLSTGVLFMARGHLGVTIVAMTNHPNNAKLDNISLEFNKGNTSDTLLDINNTSSVFNVSSIEYNATAVLFKTYDWTKSIQEMALGSFFLGYSIMMFPMGLICQRWGGKIPLQIALGLNAVISFVAPWITAWGGWKAVCFCRILQGLTQAGLYPSLQMLLAQWVPLSERGRLSTYAFTGGPLGTLAAFPIAGFLASSTWGWPSVFWLIGILCFLMFVVISVSGSASPLDHKKITAAEKNFILGQIDNGKQKKLKIPWNAMLTSKHTWATFAAHIGGGVFFVFFFTEAPSYLHYVLKVDLKNSGTLSSLPYVAGCVCNLGFGYLSDYITNNNILTVKSARILFNSIGLVGAGLCLIATSYTNNTTLGVICFIALNSFQAAVHCGWMINYLDMAPNFSGVLMATGNTLSTLCIVLLPFVTSYFVNDVTNQYQWRIMFSILGGFVILSNVIFAIFMTADVQEFNDPVEESDIKLNNIEEYKIKK